MNRKKECAVSHSFYVICLFLNAFLQKKYSMQTEMRLDFPRIRCYVDFLTAMKGEKQTTEIQMK